MIHQNQLCKWVLGLLTVAAFVLAACNPSDTPKAPTGTAGRVLCQEDEVAIPRLWVPGTPKDGLIWDCVNREEFTTN